MSMRGLGGGLGGLIVVGIVIFLKFGLGTAMSAAKVDEYAQETKEEFLALIADAEVCQGDGKNYVDWLVNNCHERAWADNHELEYVSRRRTDCVIDADGYVTGMLREMMAMARSDNAPQVAEGLAKIMTDLYPVE